MQIDKVQDINITNSIIKNQFSNIFQYNIQTAFSLLEDSSLNNKKFIANIFNQISSYLINLQSNSGKEEYENYLMSNLEYFQNLIDNFKYIGEYNSSVQYQRYNFVTYNNKIYMYINPSSSSFIPTNGTYWVRMDIDGEKGAYGIGLNLKGVWENNISYNPLDCVFYGDSIWVSIQQGINIVPPNNEYWEEIIRFPYTSFYINSNEIDSQDRYKGLIWIKTN